ncbi:MAG: hypothetical protein IPJ67_03460 [Candidatus Moraniibacteriota bacterium]|nr:MAG: hypothetical protein IPJ67_03460 [Candidatus Moranbacteria bacterium]
MLSLAISSTLVMDCVRDEESDGRAHNFTHHRNGIASLGYRDHMEPHLHLLFRLLSL